MDSITAYEDPGKYTEAEIERIKAGVAAGLCYADIAAQLPGRTVAAVATKAGKIGLKRDRTTTTEQSVRAMMRQALKMQERDGPNASAVQDKAFQAALRAAIELGLETVTEGVCTAPCTDNPKLVRPAMPVGLRSSALICFEHGDNTRAIFA